jgi:glycosyltransferase involved in cell wall biosynthesis
VSSDPYVYRDYLANSTGELSLAKNAYVASRSGWFSYRTACYLALGVPTIVQDTGFGRAITTGEGLLTFANPEEAADAIERVASDPNQHSEAARAIAEEHFDSNKVLSRLIDEAQVG